MRANRLVALAFGLFTIAIVPQIANAAPCIPVKIDPKCWGDTCATRCVKPATYSLSEARQNGRFQVLDRKHLVR